MNKDNALLLAAIATAMTFLAFGGLDTNTPHHEAETHEKKIGHQQIAVAAAAAALALVRRTDY